jgi:hypothetical protein
MAKIVEKDERVTLEKQLERTIALLFSSINSIQAQKTLTRF